MKLIVKKYQPKIKLSLQKVINKMEEILSLIATRSSHTGVTTIEYQ